MLSLSSQAEVGGFRRLLPWQVWASHHRRAHFIVVVNSLFYKSSRLGDLVDSCLGPWGTIGTLDLVALRIHRP